jgi:hypothetical protein
MLVFVNYNSSQPYLAYILIYTPFTFSMTEQIFFLLFLIFSRTLNSSN